MTSEAIRSTAEAKTIGPPPESGDRMGGAASIILACVLLLGFVLRVFAADWGLPFLYDPDEPRFVGSAIDMLTRGDYNPRWFGHPGSTVIYFNAFVYKLVCEIGRLAGWFDEYRDFLRYYYKDPTLFFIIPRLFSAVAGTLVIGATFLVGRLAFGVPAALFAALLVAATPLHVTYAHLVRTDLLATLLVLLVARQAAEILRSDSLRSYVLAGVFTGLAVATKYPAVLAAALVPVAQVMAGRVTTQWWKVLVAAVVSPIACFLASPYLFLDFSTVLANVMLEMRPTHLGATGEGFVANLQWYFVVLGNEMGWPTVGAALLGIVAAFYERRTAAILYLLFPVLFMIFISALSLRWVRWSIPLLPFVALFSGGGAAFLVRQAGRLWAGLPKAADFAVLAAFGLALSASQVYRAIGYDQRIASPDTRTVAREWVLANIPRGSRVLLEYYTPQLPRRNYDIFRVSTKGGIAEDSSKRWNVLGSAPIGILDSLDDLDRLEIEYVILGPGEGRFRAEAATYPDAVAIYDELFKRGEVIHQVSAGDEAGTGPTIRIMKINRDASAGGAAG